MINTDEPILIVSHAADLDGAASAFLAHELLDAQIGFGEGDRLTIFVDYADAVEKIKEAYHTHLPTRVIITDLSFREDIWNTCLGQIKSENFWFFDHHPSSRTVVEEWLKAGFPHVHFVDNGSMCATDLVWEELQKTVVARPGEMDAWYDCSEIADLQALVDVTRAGDLWLTEDYRFAQARDVAIAIAQTGAEKFFEALKNDMCLAATNPIHWDSDSILRFAYVQGVKEKQASEALAEKSLAVQDIATDAGETVQCKFCFIHGHGSDIGNDLCGKYGLSYAVMLDIKAGTLSFRSNRKTVEATKVTCTQLAEAFGGGGHACAAGGKVEPYMYLSGVNHLANRFMHVLSRFMMEAEARS